MTFGPHIFSKNYFSNRQGYLEKKVGWGRLFSQRKPDRVSLIEDLVSGSIFDLDATRSDSYTSGDTWSNLTTSPADGETQSTYDFFLGVSGAEATDPTFTGVGKSAYFALDGDDRFTVTNTTFLNALHKSDQTDLEFGFGLKFYWPSGITTGNYILFGTTNSSGDHGFRVEYDRTAQEFTIRQSNGTTYAAADAGSSIVMPEGWNTFFFSFQKTSGTAGTYRLKLNDDTILTGSLATFNTTTTDATEPFQISGCAATDRFPNGSRIGAAVGFNSYITEANMETIKNQWSARHNY